MRGRPEDVDEPSTGEEVTTKPAGRKRLDLSVPQVAGSAVAAVVAAKLASYFGVYGTILGAGVVSVIATCGGSLFQHFFRRTGEQFRGTGAVGREPEPHAARPGEFGEGTVYRAKVKSWKRPVVAAALVFGVTMAGITTYEMVSGTTFSGGGATTVSDALTGHGSSSSKSGSTTPSPAPSTDSGSGTSSDGAATPSPEASVPQDGSTDQGSTPAPAGSAQGQDSGGQQSADPGSTSGGTGDDGSPDPAASGTATAPAPSASSRSGTADQGQDGPAAP
ncbi:hypothetical protein [Streptomyces mangrovisoli]|uniref:hypothetical protein n=1 Tax=Streptomyces mangrovisoli TaxID=1428628 RepID=UPI001F0A4056|nr:hypothetical protein [Streptomyces mangrovisoli]